MKDSAGVRTRPAAPHPRLAWSAWLRSFFLALVAWPTLGCAADYATRDFTVFVTSDVHVGAENLKADPPVTQQDTLARVAAGREALLGLVGQGYPNSPSLTGVASATVSVPRAWFILGDLTEGHREPARQDALSDP